MVAEIAALKRRMEVMEAERYRKAVRIAAVHGRQIERDRVAEEQYLRTHQTEEQLLKLEEERKLQKQEEARDAAERAEEYMRSLLEQEAALEYQILQHDDHISFIGIGVARVARETERKLRNAAAKQQWHHEMQRFIITAGESLFREFQKGASSIDKDETRTRSGMSQTQSLARHRCVEACRTRIAKEEDAKVRAAVAAEQERQRAAEALVLDLEQAFEERCQRLAQRYVRANADATAVLTS